MLAGTSIMTERSPYIVRTSFTLAQSSVIIGDWAAKNGIRKVATLTADYAPGNDALEFFKTRFIAGGGQIVDEVKVPLSTRISRRSCNGSGTPKPDACSCSCPAAKAATS